MMRSTGHSRRAFTLIEAVVVIVALAIMVPPAVAWLNRAGHDRVDAVNATRATFLAGAVMEQVLADASSPAPGLGFAAIDTPATYLSAGGTGLYARLTPVTSPYASMGFTFAVQFGPLVSQTGLASGDAAQDVFRVVTVTVTFPASYASTPHTLSLSSMVGDL